MPLTNGMGICRCPIACFNVPMKIFVFLLTACILLSAPAAYADLPAPVAQALKAGGIPKEAVAIYARRVDSNVPVLAEHAEQPMNPASVMKLVTTYAGLELLGPAYTWRTEFYAAKPPVAGVIDGDLILKGTGDPALTLEKFWSLVRALRLAGVKEIRGDLVLDRSYFEASTFDPGAFDGDPYRPYNAGPDALLVNFKATAFHFRVDSNAVVITADPGLPQLEIVNRLKADRTSCGDWKSRLGYEVMERDNKLLVVFSGAYSAHCGDKIFDLSLPRHPEYVFQLFKTLWREQGGVFDGQLREGIAPAALAPIVSVASPPLSDVIRQINKYSNNLMARQLLVTLGAERGGLPGSPAKGVDVIRAWLAANGMELPELVLENGAGLSRIERINARHLGELLLAAYASPFMPELMSSLPVYAVDGTLKRRAANGKIAGRAHLKSGSLDGVRAVAGYLLDAQGGRWVVVFMVNDVRAANSKPAQEALLEWLYHYRD
jgi:D-alanyl-D-alanine carboxypeptidase/D-alanyl-D-alanine-endopeptidase (penicillin-binding protein 4)